MIVLIDNYDSFTYNLVQYLGDLGAEVSVHRNDKVSVDEVLALKPQGIVISPGPSDPDHAGICLDLVRAAGDNGVPLFGVCLGMQALAQAYGGEICRAPVPMHGKVSEVTHTGQGIFDGIDPPISVTRYHSLIVDRGSLPSCFDVTAETEDGLVMGLSHRDKPLSGVQFHPESIATQNGHKMLENFLKDGA